MTSGAQEIENKHFKKDFWCEGIKFTQDALNGFCKETKQKTL